MSAAPAHLGLAWLAHRTGRDLQRASRLAGGPEALWRLPAGRIAGLMGLGAQECAAISDARRCLGNALDDLARTGIAHAGLADPGYPSRLREIHDPPFSVFMSGRRSPERPREQPVVAIVGARRATAAGLAIAARLGGELARRGAVVASGLALGIDAAAHQGALDAGGDTVAVVGCGPDVVYPRRNRALYARIVEHGCVVAEYWPGTPPAPWRFPARNRILAGIADAVVVVEAGVRSGSLITADFALEIGRPVLAMPGPPGAATVAGCHSLLRAGAALCEGADDVCAELPGHVWNVGARVGEATGIARRVLDVVSGEGLSPDEVAARLSRPIPEVAGVLALLELDGLVVRSAGRFHGLPERA